MIEIISKWLSSKVNYASIDINADTLMTFYGKVKLVFLRGGVPSSHLAASEFYVMKKGARTYDYIHEVPEDEECSFTDFNLKRFSYYDSIVALSYAHQKTINSKPEESDKQKEVIISELMHRLEESIRKYKILKTEGSCPIGEVFHDVNYETYRELKQLQHKGELNLTEFIDYYIGRTKEKNRDLKELALFYPPKLDHDIFSDVHYLFEVNQFKFLKKSNDLPKIFSDLFREYHVNMDRQAPPMSLETFFIHPGLYFNKDFAYFDPFKNFEKYKSEYSLIERKIAEKSKLKFNMFVSTLFDILNEAQCKIVEFQQENLVHAIKTYRSDGRQWSVREFIKKARDNPKLLNSPPEFKNLDSEILADFDSLPNNFSITINTKIEDIEAFRHWGPFKTMHAESLIHKIFTLLNKSEFSKLQFGYEYYVRILMRLGESYNLGPKEKKIMNNMLLDVIYFYSDNKEEKLSRPFNLTIKNIYLQNQKIDLDDLIDPVQRESFIEKYSGVFNKLQPLVFENQAQKERYFNLKQC